jgi:hypothetical protein
MKNVLILLSFCILPFLACAQSDKELTEQTVNKPTIEGHIYFLASDELKGRGTGSEGIDIAAKYISTSFRRYGVKQVPGADGYFQHLDMVTLGYPKMVALQGGEKPVDVSQVLVLSGQDVTLEGELAFLGYGTEKDFRKKDLSGKVVVVNAGTPDDQSMNAIQTSMTEKINRANDAGARGIVQLTSLSAEEWKQVEGYLKRDRLGNRPDENETFFHLWLNDPQGEYQASMSNKKKMPVTVLIGERKSVPFAGKNVIGMVEGTDPELKDEFVVYSAHYDHLGIGKPDAQGDSIYNGARDNAVGVVTVMSAAENIGKYPTRRSALFILFAAEEMGLVGSRYYTENPLIPLDQTVFVFNSDNGGYNDTSVATIVGLERTTEEQLIRQACEAFGLQAIEDPAREQGLFDRSDNVNFARKGIPAPTFSMGFQAFDAEIFKYYHQAADNPETLDYDYLEKFFSAYVLACRLIANDTDKPFWKEGDKYYSAGEALYGKE